MAKLSLLAWIGNAAATLCGRHGDVTAAAQAVGCSRQTVYDHADKVQQALRDAQLPGPSRQQLLAELERLRDENRQLWQALETAVDFPQAQQQRFVVTACAMGLSLNQTLTLLALVLPAAVCPARATLGRWVQAYAAKAGQLLTALDRACRNLVLRLCLDEIFFRRQPVLVGVEPRSLAWVLGRRVEHRDGPTWCAALSAWPALREAAADGGSGLELGMQLLRQRREETASAVPLEVALDCFHTRREGERALRGEWHEAEQVWEAAERADRDLQRVSRRGQNRRSKSMARWQAWGKAERAFEQACRNEAAWRQAVAALEVFRPDGRLNSSDWAQAQLRQATAVLRGGRWAKACRMLLHPGSLSFLERLHQQLSQAEGRAAVREAVVELWRLRHRPTAAERANEAGLVVGRALQEAVCRQLAADWESAYLRVSEVLANVLRASSVVECMNSVLRMHQARHRVVSQELLDLKRLFWNCREFLEGKRREQCPYALLGLKLPTYDAWELLQLDPGQLEQQLSSQQLAA